VSANSADTGARRLLLSAFGINTGGGLVLLEALLPAVRGELRAIALDARLQARAPALDGVVECRWVPRSFFARWSALRELCARARTQDVLFCFNSLPPLTRARCRVVNYVHAPHFADLHRGIRYSWITRLRIFVERAWFRRGVRHCDEIWVQTDAMARALRSLFPAAKVVIVPFVDDALLATLPPASPATVHDGSGFTFFYPADTVGHKNHGNLLAAWVLLAREGFTPALALTVDAAELGMLSARAGVAPSALHNVQALGRLPRADVLQRLRASSALLFPSLAETFGIPLIEATAAGVPVLAPERDFVRDVCIPRESFDPSSPRSIADAVRRFIGAPRTPDAFVSARQVAAKLLA
jgi:glycosyltransferase involved in cell wall biosynthesis